jgi:hypothetical protein
MAKGQMVANRLQRHGGMNARREVETMHAQQGVPLIMPTHHAQ